MVFVAGGGGDGGRAQTLLTPEDRVLQGPLPLVRRVPQLGQPGRLSDSQHTSLKYNEYKSMVAYNSINKPKNE